LLPNELCPVDKTPNPPPVKQFYTLAGYQCDEAKEYMEKLIGKLKVKTWELPLIKDFKKKIKELDSLFKVKIFNTGKKSLNIIGK